MLAACGQALPLAPAAQVMPPSTTPAELRLVGASRSDQRVAVTAFVLTREGRPVAGASVTFTASSGALDPDVATTNAAGEAQTILTPQASKTDVRAETGGVAPVTVTLLTPFAPTPPPPTPPPPPPPADPPSPLTVSITATLRLVGEPSTFGLSSPALRDARWNFGDGGTASGVTATHVYTAAGTYEVTVVVVDLAGRTATAALRVTIAQPPPPPAPGLLVLLRVEGGASSVAITGKLNYIATVDNVAADETSFVYEWDLDGDGHTDGVTTTATRLSPVYGTAGYVTARVVVTANSGRVGSGSVRIVVTN